jgi:hypothetical protein
MVWWEFSLKVQGLDLMARCPVVTGAGTEAERSLLRLARRRALAIVEAQGIVSMSDKMKKLERSCGRMGNFDCPIARLIF